MTWLLRLNWVPGNALWVEKGSIELFLITDRLTHIHGPESLLTHTHTQTHAQAKYKCLQSPYLSTRMYTLVHKYTRSHTQTNEIQMFSLFFLSTHMHTLVRTHTHTQTKYKCLQSPFLSTDMHTHPKQTIPYSVFFTHTQTIIYRWSFLTHTHAQ